MSNRLGDMKDLGKEFLRDFRYGISVIAIITLGILLLSFKDITDFIRDTIIPSLVIFIIGSGTISCIQTLLTVSANTKAISKKRAASGIPQWQLYIIIVSHFIWLVFFVGFIFYNWGFTGVTGAIGIGQGASNWGNITLLGVVGLIITIINIVIAVFNYKSNKRSEKRKSVLDILNMYYSRDILEGNKKLRKFRESKEKTSNQDTQDEVNYSNTWWVTDYHEDIKSDPELDHQRRTVSHFWITLGTLLQHYLIDEEIVYGLWSKKDIEEIVEEVLIPVENELSKEYSGEKLPQNHALYYIRDNKDKFY